MTTEFTFKFEGVYHTSSAQEASDLTKGCVQEIINTMKECNNPDIEPSEMSTMLLEKKILLMNLSRLVNLMSEEVDVIQEESEQHNSQVIYKEANELIDHLKNLQSKAELNVDEIKTFCTDMVDVIKHILDIVTLTDKWTINICTSYINTVYDSMVSTLKTYKEFGPLDSSEITSLINNITFYTTSISNFCLSRSNVLKDSKKATTMNESASGLKKSFDMFIQFISGATDNKTSVMDFKSHLMKLKELLEDPTQFATSIDVVHKDELDSAFQNYQSAVDDPTLSAADHDAANLALLENMEGRATANLSSEDPLRARAANAIIKQIRPSALSRSRQQMIDAANHLAGKMDKMKAICDELEPLDSQIQKDMNDVTDELLNGISAKLDAI
ncbi:Uncharacterized protein QTN25_003942 [Entamoeba marina]